MNKRLEVRIPATCGEEHFPYMLKRGTEEYMNSMGTLPYVKPENSPNM